MSCDDVAIAKRDLDQTRRLIERQRRAISRLNELGRPTEKSEKVLALLERNEAIFENCHLAALEHEMRLSSQTSSSPCLATAGSQPAATDGRSAQSRIGGQFLLITSRPGSDERAA